MIPYPYNMVDMGGIDLAEANGTVVEGLYAKIVEAVNACGDVVLYNWKFAGIEISPQHTSILLGDPIIISGAVQVTEQDLVTVPGINPEPPPPLVLVPLDVVENGNYSPIDYNADGFSSVAVQVQSSDVLVKDSPPTEGEGHIGQLCIVETTSPSITFGIRIPVVARGTDYSFGYWGTCGIVFVFEDELGNEVLSTSLENRRAWWSVGDSASTLNRQDAVLTGIGSIYYEHNGLPANYKLQMDVPFSYKLKSIRIAVRLNSSYRDFWRTFTVSQWTADFNPVLSILSKENLVQEDWSFTTYTEFQLPEPTELVRVSELYLYQKTAEGWLLIK